jgi:MFS family permease
MVATALAAPWFGQIADAIGRKWPLYVSVAIFIAASAGCGLAQDLPQLIALRALQGVGGGGFMTLSQTVAADVVAPREQGRFQGYILTVWGAASVAGPLVGGALADPTSWRAIFLVNVPVGAVAFGVLRVGLRGGLFRPIGCRTSVVGSVLVGGSAVLGLLALTVVGEQRSTLGVALGGAGLVALGLFVAVERRTRFPVFASSGLRARVYVLANVGGLAIHAAMSGAVVLMPLYMQGVRCLSAAQTGLALLPQLFSWLTATVVCGLLISRTGRVKVYACLGAALTSAGLLLLSRIGAGSGLVLVCGCLVVFGVGLGLVLQALAVAAQAEVPRHEMGQATGLASFVRSAGSVFGVALAGLVVALAMHGGGALDLALQLAMLTAAPLGVCSLCCTLAMPEPRLSGVVEDSSRH